MTYNLEIDPAAVIHEFRGQVPPTDLMSLVVQPRITVSGGTSEEDQSYDIVWNNYTGATVLTEATIEPFNRYNVRFRSLTPAIATVEENGNDGRVTRVSNGTARIAAQSETDGACVNVSVSQTVEASSRTFVSYDPTSLGQALKDEVLPLLSGKTFATNAPLFSGGNWSATNWAIIGGIHLYCLSYSNSRLGAQGGATLVHPRIAMVADHWHGGVGETYTWRTPTNDTVTRTVTGYYHVTTDGNGNDTGLILLDSAVPDSILVAKLLPSDWATYLPSIYQTLPATFYDSGSGLPWLFRNQYNQLAIQAFIGNEVSNGAGYFAYSINTGLSGTEFTEFFRYGVSGDSSNGLCLVEPDTKRLIVLTSMLNPHGGSSYSKYRTSIVTAMDSLLAGAAPTYADFSSYPIFAGP